MNRTNSFFVRSNIQDWLVEQSYKFTVDYTGFIMEKKKEAPFKVGDKVTTDFMFGGKDVVRTVIAVQEDSKCGSGWKVLADGGVPCPCCKRPFACEIDGIYGNGIDSEWFKKVEE